MFLGNRPLAHRATTGTLVLASMPTADATILPPPLSSSFDDEPHSAHSLEAVGVETVLGAMIEQRRASQPSFASIVVPTQDRVLELSEDDLDDDEDGDEGRADRLDRSPAASEVFLKAR